MCERRKIKDEDLDEIFAEGAKIILANLRLKGITIAKYDGEKAYFEYPDGRQDYGEKIWNCCNCLPYDSEKNYDTKFMHE